MSDHKPLSRVEKVKELSRGLRGDLAAELAQRTTHVSDESAQLLKFHGTYQQEDRDQRRAQRGTDAEPAHQFMVRCKIPGGVLSGPQYLVIDELADRYGNGTLRVTTRQGNQFHGVLKGELKETIRAVNDALVTTLGACGDVVRNVVSCPAPKSRGLREQVFSVARRLSDPAAAHAGVPRDLARRRAGGRRTSRVGADLRDPLPAPQIQGRVRVSRRQLLRRPLERSRLPRSPGRRSAPWLQRPRGWRDGEDARQGRHLSKARRRAGLCCDGAGGRGSGGRGQGATRSRQPQR